MKQVTLEFNTEDFRILLWVLDIIQDRISKDVLGQFHDYPVQKMEHIARQATKQIRAQL